jgi:hypothetical protein
MGARTSIAVMTWCVLRRPAYSTRSATRPPRSLLSRSRAKYERAQHPTRRGRPTSSSAPTRQWESHAPLTERSPASATSFLLQLADGARALGEQLARGSVRDARGIEIAVFGRRPSRVEERGEQARAGAPGRR